MAGPRWAEYVRLNGRAGTGGRVAQADPLAVAVNQASFRAGDTMVATVRASAGVLTTAVDAYVVVQTPGGELLSLEPRGALRPGLAPLARGVVLPSVAVPFVFPLPAGVPPGLYRWIAGVTAPGTLTLAWPLVFTPFTIVP